MNLINIFYMLCVVHFVNSNFTIGIDSIIPKNTRRILGGRHVGDTRPYMVYLRRGPSTEKGVDNNWLCGGAIVDNRHVITSAACIENVQNFWVVSGTHTWVPNDQETDCIKNGAKKAVWKCVGKNYIYDGDEFDNMSWMNNDIAVVKVETDFNFDRKIKGCDYVPGVIQYNTDDVSLEKAGTVGSISGWGSTDKFSNPLDTTQRYLRTTKNSPDLLETEVVLLSKKNCKKIWDERYHYIIDESMICAKDGAASDTSLCAEREVNCKDLVYEDESIDEEVENRRRMLVKSSHVHTAAHPNDTRRTKVFSGGFCENDHGGPLVVGRGKTAKLVGVIAACLTREVTRRCYGPFLYTSIYKNRNLISCAIYKELSEEKCKVLLRSSNTKMVETIYNWRSLDLKETTVKTENTEISRTPKSTEKGQEHSTKTYQNMMDRFKYKPKDLLKTTVH